MPEFLVIKKVFPPKHCLFRLNKLSNIQVLHKEPLHIYLILYPDFSHFWPMEDAKYYPDQVERWTHLSDTLRLNSYSLKYSVEAAGISINTIIQTLNPTGLWANGQICSHKPESSVKITE